MALLHFETDKYQRNSTFLQDAEYGRALDTFVKGAQAWLAPFKHHLRKIRACAAETGARYTGCVDVLLVSEVHEVR
jgi:hypothetical protein